MKTYEYFREEKLGYLVVLVDNINNENASEFRRELSRYLSNYRIDADNGPSCLSPVTIDCCNLSHLDSSGLAIIIDAQSKQKEKILPPLRLKNLGEQPRQVIEMNHAGEAFTIRET